MTDEEIRHVGVKSNVILSSLPLLTELPTPVRLAYPGDTARPCTFFHKAACTGTGTGTGTGTATGTGTGTGTGTACKGSSSAPWEGCTNMGSDDVPAAQICSALPECYMFLTCSAQ